MLKRLTSLLLVFSMLAGLSTTALAVEKPSIPTNGATVYVDDVRVEKDATNVTAKLYINYADSFTTINSSAIKLTVPADTTGITENTPAVIGQHTGASMVTPANKPTSFLTTGSGRISFGGQPSGKIHEMTVEFTVPKVTATSKITVEPITGTFKANKSPATVIADSAIDVKTGSFIVQYPVKVEIAAGSASNSAFTINAKTTEHTTGKHTYDKDAVGIPTDLTSGGTFYVDSGGGQQNTPVLNFTVPENYYAEVTVNGGNKQTVGTSSFALPAVTKDTTVSVKLVAGQVPSDEFTNTSMSYWYGNYNLAAQDTKRFDKKGTDNTVAIKNFDGYKLVKYQINNDAAVTENLGTSVAVDISKDNTIVFTYERQDNSTVVPGPNGTIGGGDDVTITPVDKNLPAITPDGTGAVTLPADKQGVVSDDNGNSVVVPGGTKIDKDGQIWLPGQTTPTTPQNPKPTEGFYEVTYMNGGVKLFTQLGKTGQEVEVMDYPASAQKPEGKTFDGWNELNAGTGTPRPVGSKISGEKTLYAQWRNTPVDPGTLNSAKITYYSNESASAQVKEEVRSDAQDKTFPGKLNASAFSAPGEGWTLKGWLRKDDNSNKIYGASENVTLSKDEAWRLYAQWIKEESGAITVPGKDGIPGNTDDATAKPGNQGGTLNRNDKTGVITVPPGGSVTVNGKEYPMPDGGTLKPNGEISINQPNNGGSIVVKPEGGTEVVKPDGDKDPDKNAFTVTYESGEAKQPAKVVVATDSAQIAKGEAMFSFSGHKFAYWKDGNVIKAEGDTLTQETTLTAYWYAVDESGSVVIKPDPGTGPDKEIIVKPDPENPGVTPKPDKDGSIPVQPGGSVEVKPEEPNGGVIELPDGGKVNPDGTITIPGVEGKIDPNNPDTWPANILMVKYNANGGTGEMPSQLGKEKITVKSNTFTREGFQFNIWNTEANGTGTSYKEGTAVTYAQKGQVTTLYALWYKQNADGSITHPGGDGKFQPDGAKDDITVKPAPGGSVEKPDDKGSIKVPAGGSIVVPGKDGETTEIVPPTGTVITPDGKIETPDPDPTKPGGSVTIDPSKPNGGNENFLTIEFAPGTQGFGSMAACLVNKNQNFTLPANKFTSNGKFDFTGWNTQEDGNGTSYAVEITAEQLKAVIGDTLTLIAQWKASEITAKSATIIFKWNDAEGSTKQSTQTVKWNEGNTYSAVLTPDTMPTLDGWKQTSWNADPNGKGTSYALNATVTVENGKPLTLYALWVQVKDDGSIVSPGPDGKPGGGDDITVKPGPDKKPGTINPDGSITVPDGGSVKKEPDNTEIVMPDGGKVNPDGTIEIPVKNPAGTIVIKPDGGTEVQKPDGSTNTDAEVIIIKYEAGNDTAEMVEYKTVKGAQGVAAITNPFKWLKHVFSRWQDKDDTTKNYVPGSILPTDKALTLVAQWYEEGENGSIVVPVDPSTKNDDVTVKPNPTDPEKKPSVDKDGTVKVPDGGEVVTPNGSVTLPDGGKVEPDGTVKDNKGNPIDPANPDQLPDGFYQVIYNSNDGNNQTVKQTGKSLQALAADTFTNGAKVFVVWNASADGKGTSYAPGKAIPAPANGKTVELYAIWYQKNVDGDIVVKPDPDDNKEIVVKPNPDGTKPEPDKDGSIPVQPGGSVEVKPEEPNGGVIELPDGGKVNPDGTITIPGVEGKIDPNNPDTWPANILMVKYNANGGTGEMPSQLGKEKITVKSNTFTREGFQFNIWNTEANGTGTSYKEGTAVTYAQKGQVTTLYALWYKQNADGSITHPGGDGKFQPDSNDDITVKPNPDKPGVPPTKDDNTGNIKVPDGGSIIVPDGTEITPPPGTVITPDGKIEFPDKKPDGSGETVDPSKPGELPAGYFYVTYKAGKGTGTDRKQMAKTGDKALAGTIFTAPANKFFTGWKVENEDRGINPGQPLTLTADLVLVAQWSGNGAENPDLTYSATVKYYRSASDTNPTVETHRSNSSVMRFALKNNDILQDTSWSSVASGWALKGWTNQADGKFYVLGADFDMTDKGIYEMYAVWSKEDGDNLIVPGPDGKPGGNDDITVKPNPDDATKKPEVNPDGSVKVPDGGVIIIPGANSPTDDKTITVKPGATVKPDGSIVLPDKGTATIQPDGTTINGPGTIDPGKLPTPNPDPDQPYYPGNGTIVLPGKDGKTGTGDDVIVKPDNGTKDNDGNITTKGDKTDVKYPDQPNGNGATVTVPEGTVVKPDGTIDNIPTPGGTIKLPDGTEITVPGGSKVEPDGSVKIPDGSKGEITKPAPGGDIPGGSTIDKDGTITLPDGGTMKPDGSYKYTVVLKSSSGVTLTTSGFNSTIWVKKGAPQTITAPAVSGYLITDTSSVTVTGGQQVTGGGYTITFTYRPETTGGGSSGGGGSSTPSYIIKATANTGGSISPKGNVSVVRGSDKVFTITPNSGYKISDVEVDGKSVGARSTYTFEDIRKAHTIEVFFEKSSGTTTVADPKTTGVANLLETTQHNKFLNGFADGTFGPGKNMTRGQVAQMFFNLLKDKDVAITVNFTDVPADAWYAQAVNTLASLGIITGKADGRFDPNAPITRAQFVAIISRFAKASGGSVNFTDVTSNAWYYNYLCTAVNYGWINGKADGSFAPNANITRAEVAVIVCRMLDRSGDASAIADGGVKQFSDVPSTFWAYLAIMEAANGHAHTVKNGTETWGDLFQ